MGSGHKKSNHLQYGERPFQTRRALPVVTVVCDDTKTAVAYFNELKRVVKKSVTVRVEPAPRCGASPNDVVKLATKFARTLAPKEKGDSVWALVDTEVEQHKQDQAQQAKRQAAGRQVEVLLSRPCYDVWTLAHFIDTGEAFNDCNAVLTRIKVEWKRIFKSEHGNKKGQADYAKLMPLRFKAVENAKKRAPEKDMSWTDVYKAVEAIDLLFNDQAK